MNRTFADSFYFLALFNSRDAAHDNAVKASAGLQGMLVTTDWILTETADALCDSVNRAACVAMIDDIRRSARIEIVPATRALFDTGWQLYGQRRDKDWSLTDCISFTVMREHAISEALTGDRHFEQAGFRAILK